MSDKLLKFSSRGAGQDWLDGGCFVCGANPGELMLNISAYTGTSSIADAIAPMFKGKARIHRRTDSAVQVKVGCCATHEKSLQLLHNMTMRNGETITQQMVDDAIALDETRLPARPAHLQ